MIPDKATVQGAHVPVADGAPAGVDIGVKIEADEVRNGTFVDFYQNAPMLSRSLFKLRLCLLWNSLHVVSPPMYVDCLRKTSSSDHSYICS